MCDCWVFEVGWCLTDRATNPTFRGMRINIEIGDWSGDGHSKCDIFTFESNLPIEEVREAYFKARELHPEICPEGFCAEYEDPEIPKKVRDRAKQLGFKFRKQPDTRDLADFTAWFCMLGDDNLCLTRTTPLERLAFYGSDEGGRHIDFIGYGLF